MYITIKTGQEYKTCKFNTIEELCDFRDQIVAALEDPTNTKKAEYVSTEDKYLLFPALLLKNSLIEVNQSESAQSFL